MYDFTVHNRSEETIHIVPRQVIIVEGILIFENEDLRNLMDIRIFVDLAASNGFSESRIRKQKFIRPSDF